MDWATLLNPISSQMQGNITLAVTGVVAMLASPLLVKGGISVAAWAMKYLYGVFGG